MLHLTITIIALLLYCGACIYLATLLYKKHSLQQQWLLILQCCAVAMHGVNVYQDIFTPLGINLTIGIAFSLVIFTINTIVTISSLRNPLYNLQIFLLPLSIVAVVLSLLTSDHNTAYTSISIGLGIHIILSVLAYSLLAIATFQALLLYWQNNHLKKTPRIAWLKYFPPLQTMEALMFEVLWVGVILLLLAMSLGALYIDNMFAQHLAHKTILSMIAMCIFVTLLWGRAYRGWRAYTAIRWVLSGFCTLMLAYFGSKLVLEVILV